MQRKLKSLSLAVAISFLALGSVLAQDKPNAIKAPATKTIGSAKPQVEPALIVLNSKGASLKDGKLVLTGISSNSIMFADRPVRAAGHVLTAHLLEEWATGKDSFAADPPNATVSVLMKDGSDVLDAVVTLNAPKIDGDDLSFDVEVLEGSLDGADGPASTFIDIIGMPFTPRSFAGVARRTAYRGAWYGGAVAGAAMAAPYPYYARPACGPYPYPPCY
ncbi:hypothetical protein LJR231_006115 [Phyllobacterium sp. LjRoot231]|uniref:hypothetical protein n=1 Tax=Phyllobacterium sp. LjRoot231 TaxID=3342289 RepID=UPI003ED16A16